MIDKCNIGDKVYCIRNNKVRIEKITGIILELDGNFRYRISIMDNSCLEDYTWFDQKDLFLTKEELIKDIIDKL